MSLAKRHFLLIDVIGDGRGKARAIEKDGYESSADEREQISPIVIKRSKGEAGYIIWSLCADGETTFLYLARAETRPCPICKEKVPLRLLGRHAALEAERLDNIIAQIGSETPIRDEYDEEYAFPSPSLSPQLPDFHPARDPTPAAASLLSKRAKQSPLAPLKLILSIKPRRPFKPSNATARTGTRSCASSSGRRKTKNQALRHGRRGL